MGHTFRPFPPRQPTRLHGPARKYTFCSPHGHFPLPRFPHRLAGPWPRVGDHHGLSKFRLKMIHLQVRFSTLQPVVMKYDRVSLVVKKQMAPIHLPKKIFFVKVNFFFCIRRTPFELLVRYATPCIRDQIQANDTFQPPRILRSQREINVRKELLADSATTSPLRRTPRQAAHALLSALRDSHPGTRLRV